MKGLRTREAKNWKASRCRALLELAALEWVCFLERGHSGAHRGTRRTRLESSGEEVWTFEWAERTFRNVARATAVKVRLEEEVFHEVKELRSRRGHVP